MNRKIKTQLDKQDLAITHTILLRAIEILYVNEKAIIKDLKDYDFVEAAHALVDAAAENLLNEVEKSKEK